MCESVIKISLSCTEVVMLGMVVLGWIVSCDDCFVDCMGAGGVGEV